jgi:phenylpropionate dioxygenase-like ring-hydroxylating dioxygenase large terminal subunit
MAERVPFLNTAYSAYHHRERPAEDEELTRVGPGTPCGEYMRRFWQPVILSSELNDLPRRLRILGEDLVAFRDGSGAVGLLELHCPHRGTSLEFGLIGEKGIRCCYHGWLFDVDGTILETPGEPTDSTLKDRLFHGAYPVREYQGLVFAYMGPPDRQPDFPMLDTYDLPGYQMAARAPTLWDCNWLQVKDNSMDPAHLAFLHTLPGSEGFTEDLGALGEWDWMETPAGMVYIDTRRQGDRVWVRVADFMPPNIHQFTREIEDARAVKTGSRPVIIRWAVPNDDTHTTNFELSQVDPAWRLTSEEVARPGFGQSDDRPYTERQRHPADFDAQSSQRPIAVHALEHLASTDRGVIMLRRLVREGIRAVMRGEDPFGSRWPEDRPVRTFSQDAVLEIPPAPTAEEDRRLLRETGRRLLEA